MSGGTISRFQMIGKPIHEEKTLNIIFSLSRQNTATLNQQKQIHAHLLKTLLCEIPLCIGPLLAAAAASRNASSISYAREIFDHVSLRNTFMYNSMIRGFVENNLPKLSVFFYLDMLRRGFMVNNYTFPPLIKAFSLLASSNRTAFTFGCMAHTHVVKFGFSNDLFAVSALIEFYTVIHDMEAAQVLFDRCPGRDVVIWTGMIDGYGKVGDVEKARKLFDEMPHIDAIQWSAMMAAYSTISDFKEVLSLFRRMQESGTPPNESTLVSVLTACAHLGAISQGTWVHCYAKRLHLESNPILATALVDMYSKCGCVMAAMSVFKGIIRKDEGTWNAMISGFAINGHADGSLLLFGEMIKSGVPPTEATFTSLFTACTHSRMVKEGLELFAKMSSVGVEPQLAHCACVVDLLGRAGMIEDAEKFTEQRIGAQGDTDSNAWGALLGACRIYANVGAGDRVWKKMGEMGLGTTSGAHALSYNIYMEAGWGTEAKLVRKSFSDLRLKKRPGCSIIEVNRSVQEFRVGDQRHPQAHLIYAMLRSFPLYS